MKKLFKKIDIADVLIVSGTGGIGYGLYLYNHCVSFTVVGAIALMFGIALSRK